ncbi:NAD(P)-dependent oxidoreductase [Sinomicrobium soli]|uniref:NAD(P)-dependent oxidoreductase n=1 Tax=Sinomicrobium sp. N-1-3-6 TaxID=2219864 RepID=UPI000DCCBC89|nr:NAD(P)-dependent oxidoreductase [Sinomicrobium sp. N-1-3-6]RAV30255.1 alanine dehydrogenase [Sinomicrobium sp. N-1-3-6]
MRIGIIRERKNPPDRRVVLSPAACKKIRQQFPEVELCVEPSEMRVFRDEEYEAEHIPVTANMQACDILLGVKEVPVDALIPGKKYFFFSHTIKKQPYNRELLRAVLDKNIELYDHEVITAPSGQRLVAFGRYAGIVGTYNGLRAYGLRSGLYDLPGAWTLPDMEALLTVLRGVRFPGMKILLTGKGRVGAGAREILEGIGLREVGYKEYLASDPKGPVYCQIDVTEYNKRKDGKVFSPEDFYQNPGDYVSDFFRFARETDLYIAGHFYGEGAPPIITREDMRSPDFRIRVIADISCDIDGPVAATIRASTIAEPLYGYDPHSGEEVGYREKNAITVMAVDNLPCELPRDASEGFGEMFSRHVIPAFFDGDKEGILERARMTFQGKLTPAYAYLQDYADGKE